MTTKAKLRARADRLRRLLASEGYIKFVDGTFVIDRGATDKESIAIQIGTIPSTKISFEVWFDGETGWPGRRFWWGSVTKDRTEMGTLIQVGQSVWGRPGKMIDLSDPDSKHPRTKAAFGKIPVWEGHLPKPDWQFLGIYEDHAPSVISNKLQQIAKRISSIARATVEVIGRRDATLTAEVGDPAVGKDRKRVLGHAGPEIWIRDSAAARKAKMSVGYKCEVCGEQLGQKYGGDIGKDFAEAHHRIPLKTLEGMKVNKITAKHLICVCANCHRMLHRLIGKMGLDGQKAIDDLRTRVSKARRAGRWVA